MNDFQSIILGIVALSGFLGLLGLLNEAFDRWVSPWIERNIRKSYFK